MTKLQDVNTTDIAGAIRLGCQTMGNVFNADDNDVPFFQSVVYPEARLSFSEFVLRRARPGPPPQRAAKCRRVLGVTIPEEVIDKHARAAFFSYRTGSATPESQPVTDR